MKKTMKLWLFMLIMLLLTGCGNNGDSSDTTERKEDESSTSIEVENNEDNRMEEPAWDTKWASNEFENLIPQPPFNGWKGEKKSDYEYEMVTSEANADGSGNYYEEFKTYVLSLKDLGFEVEGDFNEFNVKDSKGNKIKFLCGDGHAWITMIMNSDSSEKETTKETGFNKNWANEEFEILIPEPPFAYEVEVENRGSEITFEIKSTNGGPDGDVTHEKILTYCEDIKNAGFSESIREGEIGERYGRTCYEFYAENGNRNCVNLIDDGGGVVVYAIISVE